MRICIFGLFALLSACDDKADAPMVPDEGIVEITDEDNDGAAAEIDCDDNNPQAHPGALEVCDGADNDCDGEIDEEAIDAPTVYTDSDGDGFGDPDTANTTCETDGLVDNGSDCDDTSADAFPGNTEVCDGVDNDCDGSADTDATDAATWYTDADGDGFGDAETASVHCDADEDEVSDGSDCDDSNELVYPDAEEICDGLDNDCDGETDTDVLEPPVWYTDLDGDGFGAASSWDVHSCDAPIGYVADDTDCDNLNPEAYPEAIEVCDGADNNCDGEVDVGVDDAPVWYTDADGDGFGDAETALSACDEVDGYVEDATDCNDDAATAYPGGEEVCDGIDNDCDEDIDEDSTDRNTFYRDFDEDSFGDADETIEACAAPEGYVEDDTDCDDEDGTSMPGGTEVCDDVDNDCDGDVDEDVLEPPVWYVDLDSDGIGASSDWDVAACEPPTGYVGESGDCNNLDPAIHPDAMEVCDGIDNNCDELTDIDVEGAPMWYADADGDGFGDLDAGMTACDEPDGYVEDATDCNDEAATAYPGGEEACDGLDNDCDEEIDEDSADRYTFFRDFDEDLFGDPDVTVEACAEPPGHVSDATDCDDEDPLSNPAGIEVCDEADNDCDGDIDEDSADAPTWYVDLDTDGFGTAGEWDVVSCSPPAGYVALATDCDNLDPSVHPDAVEVCDGIDNNCDEITDIDVADAPEWYEDTDGDGFGDAESMRTACDEPDGYVADSTDCLDSDAGSYPGATEACDGIDNDCDEEIDEDSADRTTYYKDADADGFGAATEGIEACAMPDGHVADDSDCDDTDGSISPDGIEICDDRDNDCDGTADEDSTDAPTWYIDFDSDGFGATGEWDATQCDAPSGYVDVAGDCAPLNDNMHPDATEYCNGEDDDCDGEIDDDAADVTVFYIDLDGDGYGTSEDTETGCSPSDGYAADPGDCNDEDHGVHPGETEVPGDGIDQNCDGSDAALGVFLGDLTIANDTIAETFCASYSSVAGSLIIDGDGLTSLALLACLVEVYGDLNLQNGSHWVSTSLPYLARVHGDVAVHGYGPVTFSMPVLSEVGGEFQIREADYTSIDLSSLGSVDGYFSIETGAAGTDVALNSLVSAEEVSIAVHSLSSLDMSALSSTSSLSLQDYNFDYGGDIEDISGVSSIDIGSLSSLESLYIDVQAGASSSLNLSGLESISGETYIRIRENEDGGTLDLNLSGLTTTEGEAAINGRGLSSIDLAALSSTNNLRLEQMAVANLSLGALAGSGSVYVQGENLESLNLDALTTGTEVYLRGQNLTSINVSALQSADSLSVFARNLDALDLSALTAVSEATLDVGLATLDLSQLAEADALYIQSPDGTSSTSIDLSAIESAGDIELIGLQDLTDFNVGNGTASINSLSVGFSSLADLDLSAVIEYEILIAYCNDALAEISGMESHTGNSALIRLWGNALSWDWFSGASTLLTQLADIDAYGSWVAEDYGESLSEILYMGGNMVPLLWTSDDDGTCSEEWELINDPGDTGSWWETLSEESDADADGDGDTDADGDDDADADGDDDADADGDDDDDAGDGTTYTFAPEGSSIDWYAAGEEMHYTRFSGFSSDGSYGFSSFSGYVNFNSLMDGHVDGTYRWVAPPNEDLGRAIVVGGEGSEAPHYLTLAWNWADDITIDLCVLDTHRAGVDLSKSPDESTIPGGLCATHSDGTAAYWERMSQEPMDADGDGYSEEDGDCNDDDPSVYPGAYDEYDDGIDQDCDGEDATDFDGDGYSVSDGDCEDEDSSIYPGAIDEYDDGIDQDCDGEDATDFDGDGYSVSDGDCEDEDASIYPGAEDIEDDGIDQDCDGEDAVGDVDLSSLETSWSSGGRTVYVWESNPSASLSSYNTFCEERGLSWYVPNSSADAQKTITDLYNRDGTHTWIITKNNTTLGGTWGGYSVTVDSPSCVNSSSSGFSAIRKWGCSMCDPELHGTTSCWDGHPYDWLVCMN